MNNKDIFQHNLPVIRNFVGVSQKSFAKMTGISPASLRMWENDECKIPKRSYYACLYVLEHEILPTLKPGDALFVKRMLKEQVKRTDQRSIQFET